MSLPDTDPESATETPATDSVALDEWPVFEMEYAIGSTDTGDLCTVYPRDLSDELSGEWITAGVGSFVPLDSVR